MRNSFRIFSQVMLILLFAKSAFPIGKTGNNILSDSRDHLFAKVPDNYPYVNNVNATSLILRSNVLIRSPMGFLDQASFRAVSFRDFYPNLINQSLVELKSYFLQASKMDYQVISESSDKMILLGQNEESIVGIVVAPGGRGVVFISVRNAYIKQGIIDTINAVVFQ